ANLERVFATFPVLRERASQAAGALSGGEQQMLAIGRGLMSDPRLLILDEPSLGLSPRLTEEMFALMRSLNTEGLAIMVVEQNIVQSLEIASRAYVIENGVGGDRRKGRGGRQRSRSAGRLPRLWRKQPHNLEEGALHGG